MQYGRLKTYEEFNWDVSSIGVGPSVGICNGDVELGWRDGFHCNTIIKRDRRLFLRIWAREGTGMKPLKIPIIR